MPATRWQRAHLRLRASAPWRRAWGGRTVRRRVQGIDLYLPWSHLLPDFAQLRPSYGQNLVELAIGLAAQCSAPLQVIDIGANVGDSALQIANRANARALCVEGDPYWVEYLRRNTDGNHRIVVESALLCPDDSTTARSVPVRNNWTTKFVPAEAGTRSIRHVSVSELRRRHPDFDSVRLVKSDTDGFDTKLIAAAARVWSAASPVLFFEFDPVLTREVAECEPGEVWEELASLGYSRLAIWDNTGDPLGQLDIADAQAAAVVLDPLRPSLGYDFWDVAACKASDGVALAVFDALLPSRLDPPSSA